MQWFSPQKMESTLQEALISLRDSRAELQDIKNEFKIWRNSNPNAQLDSGQGSFLYQELSAARKREETSQKTLQVLLKSMKNFQMLNNSEKLNDGGKRKRDNDEVHLKTTETESSSLKKLKSLDESDLKVKDVQEKVGAENDGSSSSSSESDDSDSKSTSSDIANSSSSDSSNSDSNSSESSSDTASESSKSSSGDSKNETHKVKAQPITIPGNLTKAKLKAARRMKDMPAIHHYFDEDHPETLDKNHIPFKVQPYVKYSETHLYNPKNISLCNSKKKKNQTRQDAEIMDTEEHQTLNDDITPIMVDYDSLDLYSDKRPPPEGSMIVFKVRLEMINEIDSAVALGIKQCLYPRIIQLEERYY